MAKIKQITQPTPTTIPKFLGLNLDTTGDTGLKLGESGNMNNWKITENYKLKRRIGYEQVMANIPGTCRGLWDGKLNDTLQLISVFDTVVYARKILSNTDYASLDTSTFDNVDVIVTTELDTTTAGTIALDNIVKVDRLVEVADIDVDYNASDGKYFYSSDKKIRLIVTKGTYADIAEARTGLGSLNAYMPIGTVANTDLVKMFAFADKLYFQDGSDYKSWDGTGAVTTVTGYVPVDYTAVSPDGDGTALEGINLINPQVRTKFSSNGTGKVYQLPDTDLDSVDKVYLLGELQTITTDYTVDLSAGTVTFVAQPASGDNDVEIYRTKDYDLRTQITNCRTSMLFGGENDTRVFMWGDDNYKNRVYYSDLDGNGLPSAEYFPALNYNSVGSSEYAITDIVRQYDRQIIFKENESSYSYYDAYTDTENVTRVTFPVSPLNQVKGNVAFDQVRIVNNNPYSVFHGVQECVSSQVRDERNFKFISKRVQPDLDLLDLTTAITVDWEEKWEYWLCIGKVVYIHNYRLDLWYKYTLADTPTVFKVIDNEMYFGTTNTIMKFDKLLLTDNGTLITDRWEMNFYDFGAGWLRKQIRQIWISMQPETKAQISVSWETDRPTTTTPTAKTARYNLFSFESFDFTDFTFNTNYTPKPFKLKIKAKKFTYFKLIIENNTSNTTATVLNIIIPQHYGGESK